MAEHRSGRPPVAAPVTVWHIAAVPRPVDDDLNGPFTALAELAEAFNGLVKALVEDGELTAITTGAIFAAYCSLAMHNELVLQEPVAQRRAMEVHREIGVAVGILMATGDLTTTAAYERLHRASRHLQRSLSDVAREVIAQGHLAEPPDADRSPDR
jgi:ANTAR domain